MLSALIDGLPVVGTARAAMRPLNGVHVFITVPFYKAITWNALDGTREGARVFLLLGWRRRCFIFWFLREAVGLLRQVTDERKWMVTFALGVMRLEIKVAIVVIGTGTLATRRVPRLA